MDVNEFAELPGVLACVCDRVYTSTYYTHTHTHTHTHLVIVEGVAIEAQPYVRRQSETQGLGFRLMG
jgi:hypothetical protein